MAYVNFKEEIYKANKQLEHRRENNTKLYKQIIKHHDSVSIEADERYSFKTFEKRTFNTSKTEDEKNFLELSNHNIVCSEFINCKFYNIKFKECMFIGCTFKDCDFGGGGVIFENCYFLLEELNKVPSLNKKDNLSCTFEKCKIYSKFSGCNISYLIMDECYLKDTSFELSDMTSMIIVKSEMKSIDIVDVDMSGAKIYDTYIEDLEFNDKLKSKLDEKSFIGKIELRKKTKAEYEGIYKVYEAIADKFKENTLNNNFGEYYYLCKDTQRKCLKPLPKISSYIYWITCGYGERISFPLITSLILILIFAIIYLVVGVDIDGVVVGYIFQTNIPKAVSEFIIQFNESLNLSTGMFLGVGINNSQPIPISHMISNVEMVIGTIMMGVGIGTLTRKLIR